MVNSMLLHQLLCIIYLEYAFNINVGDKFFVDFINAMFLIRPNKPVLSLFRDRVEFRLALISRTTTSPFRTL